MRPKDKKHVNGVNPGTPAVPSDDVAHGKAGALAKTEVPPLVKHIVGTEVPVGDNDRILIAKLREGADGSKQALANFLVQVEFQKQRMMQEVVAADQLLNSEVRRVVAAAGIDLSENGVVWDWNPTRGVFVRTRL